MRKNKLLLDTLMLSASSVLMSAIAMVFQVWLAGRIGAAGIGLFQLITSVTSLGMTFAVSGIRFAATRLVSEELSDRGGSSVRRAMRSCLGYGLFFGSAAWVVLWLLAEPIGVVCIGDARTVLSLRISAFSMPCIALCSAISGYFTACGRVWKPTLVHLFEQLISIAAAAFFLRRADTADIASSCAAVTLGRLSGDLMSIALMAGVYLADMRRHCSRLSPGSPVTGRMLRIAVPLAASAYARSALSTALHLLVPRGLKKHGASADAALAGYGTIQGMALPVLLFPACIMSAVAELIVPQLTEAQLRHNVNDIRETVSSLVGKALRFSLITGLVMMLLSDFFGNALYHSADAGRYIRLIAPLVPVMYTDMVIDGCLKGLGQQLKSMVINIIDVLTGLIMVLWLLPLYGLPAYIAMIFLTETLNTALSAVCLRRAVKTEASCVRVKDDLDADGVMV